jgi:carbon-monoxide dehydrogenase medium subunit
MKLPEFDYRCPSTLAEAVELLSQGEGASRPIAGGQSLVPLLAFRMTSPSVLVDLGGLSELRKIEVDSGGVHIGAMVRWRDIEKDARLRQASPLLFEAVSHIAHYQIRNRGTVGGSLAHADPAAEMPGVAVTCEARIEVVGVSGRRNLSAESLFVGPLTTSLSIDEIIVGIHLPAWPETRRWAFEEFAQRHGDFALAAIALYYDEDASGAVFNAHIGAIGVGDIPLRLSNAEKTLNGQTISPRTIADVVTVASGEVDPMDDIFASSRYRCALVGTLLERALARASI